MLRQEFNFSGNSDNFRRSLAIATFLDVVAKTLTNNLSRNLERCRHERRGCLICTARSSEESGWCGEVGEGRAGQAWPGRARQGRGQGVKVGRVGRVGRVGVEGWIWRAGWCQEWRACTGWCKQGGEGWERAGWGSVGPVGADRLEQHLVWAGTGPSGRSCCKVPINGSLVVCRRSGSHWENVSYNFRHLDTGLGLCDSFRLIVTILD